MSGRFTFVDIETTGLEPAGGVVLEVGIIVMDSDLEHVVAMEQFIVPHSDEDMVFGANDYVMKMHEKSGLFEHIKAMRVGTEDHIERMMEMKGVDRFWAAQQAISEQVTTFLDSLGVKNEPLCGSSVHFDRKWLEYHMPRILDRFSYRNIDVSSFLETIRLHWGVDQVHEVVVNRGRHRSVDDLQDTIATLKNALAFLADPPAIEKG